MDPTIKALEDLIIEKNIICPNQWKLKAFISEECLSYVVWNSDTDEGIIIDPKKEILENYISFITANERIRWLGVIDSHTHADHISAAADIAVKFQVPLIMTENSPSRRVHIRICEDTFLPTVSGPLHFFLTPGHTSDGMCILWGPFLFTGDTIIYGDVGRDDLPSGNPQSHYESILKLKSVVNGETLVMPGHDSKGGRVSTWKNQLEINSSLTQPKEEFIGEMVAFVAPPPKQFKVSLFENFK